MRKIPVREFMSKELLAAKTDMHLTELVSLLGEHGVRAVPVVDDEGTLLGVVSESDLFLKEKGLPFTMEKVPALLGEVIDKQQMLEYERCKEVTVGEVMSGRLVSVTEDATLENVALLMLREHLSLVPVEEDGRLVGTVRRINVLRLIYLDH